MEFESILVIVIAAVFIILLWIIVGYRNMKGLSLGIKKQWGFVMDLLKKRQDMVPILVELVRSFTDKQEELIGVIIKQRIRAAHDYKPGLDKIISEHDLTHSINRLVDLGKIYKELGADTTFLELRKELRQIEEDIENEVSKYNERVRYYNRHRDSIIILPLAVIFRFGIENIFEVES